MLKKYLIISLVGFVTTLSAEKFRICITWSSTSFSNTFANRTQFYFRANPSTAEYKIVSSAGVTIYQGVSQKYLQVSGNSIYVEGVGTYSPPLYVRPVNTVSTFVSIRRPDSTTWRTYRGEYEIRVNNGYLMVINIVELEDYVCGVIPNEIGSTAPQEALKAQAVVTRTAAYGKREGAHTSEPFDLCSTMHCQVYGDDSSNKGGKDTERSSSNNAVYLTQGIVIKYGTSIAKWVNYFATCGGRTARNEDVWGSAVAYLQSVVDDPDEVEDTNDTDDYCYDSNTNSYPYYYWTYTTTLSDLETKLKSNSNTTGSGSLTGVEVAEYDISGRAKYVNIYYTGGTKKVRGDTFRAAIGYSTLKSTKFTISTNGTNYTFTGKGFGHGVGMCQVGAIGMANKGKKYDEIIKHYYTNNVILSDIAPPLIFHTPVVKTILGSSVTIRADVMDSNGISSVKLFYKRYTDSSYSFKNMISISSTTYEEFIPASFAVAAGIQYYIEATDIGGNKGTTEIYFVYVSTHTVGPEIKHTPQPYVLEKTFFTISCQVADPDGVKTVVLYYKNAIQQNFLQVNMQTSDNYNYSYTIEPFQVVLGEFKYYITAVDNYGYTSNYGNNTTPVTVMVVSSSTADTSGPSITHTVSSTYTVVDSPIPISCKVTDETGVKQVKLYYKNSVQQNFISVSMLYSGNNIYNYTIPSSEVVEGILSYYIVAEDFSGNTSYYRSAQDPVIIFVIPASSSPVAEVPKVVFEPITEINVETPLEMLVYAEDSTGIDSVVVYYKNTNETVYKQKKFTEIGGGYYQVIIPYEDINLTISTPSLNYFIIVTNRNNKSIVLPQNAPNETYKVIIIISETNRGNEVVIQKDKIFVTKTNKASIKFSITPKQSTQVKFTIYNLYGQEIKKITSWQQISVNNNIAEITWDGKDETNLPVVSGVYLYKLEIGNLIVKTGKIVVVR